VTVGTFCTTLVAAGSRPACESVAFFEARSLHPQDGPHVDLRFRVEGSEFTALLSMNLVFLDWMLDVPREDPERVDPAELAVLAPRLEAYFAAQMPVEIDGVRVTPILRDIRLNDPDPVLLPLFPISGNRGLRKVEFSLFYPGKQPPAMISVAWPAYPPDLLSVLASKPPLEIASEWTADGLRSMHTFTRVEPGFTWHRPVGGVESRLERVPTPPQPEPLVPAFATLAILVFLAGFGAAAAARRPPLVALGSGLLAAAVVLVVRPMGPAFLALGTRAPREVPAAEAAATFEALQANLYRAFDYEAESAVYDALARSVSGGLLEETYLGVRRALVMEEEGGAMSRVVAVRPVRTDLVSQGEIELDDGRRVRAFKVEAAWQVDGRVTHWGHSHDRTNEYDGRFTVAAEREGWRIHDAEITRQERVDAGTAPAPQPSPEDEEL
jgi:hypothetical protein